LPILPNRERHDRIVALVEEMLALHRRLAASRTDHERMKHYLKEIEEMMTWLRRLIPSSTP
jgi:hypothetical protein